MSPSAFLARALLAFLIFLSTAANAAPGPEPFRPAPIFGYMTPGYGSFSSAAAACAANNGPHLNYIPYTQKYPNHPYAQYYGDCIDPRYPDWFQGYVYTGYHCPAGYYLTGATHSDYNVASYGNGPNLSCQCNTEEGRYFKDVATCLVPTPATPPRPSDPKNNGKSCPSCGNPINPGTGAKFQSEVDFASAGPGGLLLARFYNGNPLSPDAEMARSSGTRWTLADERAVIQELVRTAAVPCWRRPDTGYVWCEEREKLAAPSLNPQAASLLRPDGQKYYFKKVGDAWVKDGDVNGAFTALYNASSELSGWSYTGSDGAVERYDAHGRLIFVTARSGLTQRYTYSTGASNDTSQARSPADAPVCGRVQAGALLPAGRLLCVTDHWGAQLHYEYNGAGKVSKAIDPAGQGYLYEYNGESAGCFSASPASLACQSGNLTKVTYPDGKSRTYHYNEAALINNGQACPNVPTSGAFGHLFNALTGMTDENGVRYATWAYDCAGRAVSSEHPGGVDKVTLAYGTANQTGEYATTVTNYTGDPAAPLASPVTYRFTTVLGVAKSIGIDQACANCGPVKSATYDVNGNPKTRVDRNNTTTSYEYDLTRNLETARTEAFGTLLARTISTDWHPQYRLPAKIAEPLRITTLQYDGAGNLLSRSVQGTSDKTGALKFTAASVGAARKWTYTYHPTGQVKTLTGPRTDVVDTTTYEYDGAGNLSTIKNAAGHLTTLSNYDGNGRVGRITAPNNVVTDITYWPRGWVKSRKTGVELTSYDYDGAGQLTSVRLPGGAVLTYTYDDAHRLIGVSDLLGNSIRYTLDLSGNRTLDQTKDPLGTVVRQSTRVFDSLNQLKELTGAAQ